MGLGGKAMIPGMGARRARSDGIRPYAMLTAFDRDGARVGLDAGFRRRVDWIAEMQERIDRAYEDNAADLALDHRRQKALRELHDASEVELQFVLDRLRRHILHELSARPAGIVDKAVGRTESGEDVFRRLAD